MKDESETRIDLSLRRRTGSSIVITTDVVTIGVSDTGT
jgi:hypothetical protein